MDRPFDKPLILSDGQTVITLASITEAGAWLLQEWPPKKRRRPAYREAIEACRKALSGKVGPEVARQALLAALVDLWGKSSPVESDP